MICAIFIGHWGHLDYHIQVVVDVDLAILLVAKRHLHVVLDCVGLGESCGHFVETRCPCVVLIDQLSESFDCIFGPQLCAKSRFWDLNCVLERLKALHVEPVLDKVESTIGEFSGPFRNLATPLSLMVIVINIAPFELVVLAEDGATA